MGKNVRNLFERRFKTLSEGIETHEVEPERNRVCGLFERNPRRVIAFWKKTRPSSFLVFVGSDVPQRPLEERGFLWKAAMRAGLGKRLFQQICIDFEPEFLPEEIDVIEVFAPAVFHAFFEDRLQFLRQERLDRIAKEGNLLAGDETIVFIEFRSGNHWVSRRDVDAEHLTDVGETPHELDAESPVWIVLANRFVHDVFEVDPVVDVHGGDFLHVANRSFVSQVRVPQEEIDIEGRTFRDSDEGG